MYTGHLRFEHGAHQLTFNQPLRPQSSPPDDNMSTLDTASTHKAKESHFRYSGLPDFMPDGKLICVHNQHALYHAVNSTNPWPSQMSFRPHGSLSPPIPYRSTSTSTSRKDSTQPSASSEAELKESRRSASSQRRWHKFATSRCSDKGSALAGRKLCKRSKPVAPSSPEPDLELKDVENAVGTTSEGAEATSHRTSPEQSTSKREGIRSIISTPQYDYDHHANRRCSWVPLQKNQSRKHQEANELPASRATGPPCLPECDPAPATQSSPAGEADKAPATNSSLDEEDDPREVEEKQEHNDKILAPSEQPFWDVSNNISRGRDDRIDGALGINHNLAPHSQAASGDRALLFAHEGGSIPKPKAERKPRKAHFAARKGKPRSLKSTNFEQRRALSPVLEGSESSSSDSRSSTPEILTARVQWVERIELSPAKIQELEERRRKAQERSPDVPEMPVILVTDPEGNRRFDRVDSVTEKERTLKRMDKREELRGPSFL